MLWFNNIFASIDRLWLDFGVSVSSKQLDNFAGDSTSLPGGNQVDGLPPAFSYWTVVYVARQGGQEIGNIRSVF